jgi:type IX secretion system PorP/SprF family membrane protein
MLNSKHMKKRLLCVLLLMMAVALKSQHPYFASPDQQLLSLNPAFAGSNKQLRVQTAWNSNSFSSSDLKNRRNFYTGADFLAGKNTGLGISFHKSRVSWFLQDEQLSVSYSYQFTIKNKMRIVPGFQASYFRRKYIRSINENIIPDDGIYSFSYAPYLVTPNQSKQNLDFSTGLLFYMKNFFISVSGMSITQPDEGLLGVRKRGFTQVYYAGYKFETCEKSNVSPYVLVKSQSWGDQFVQYGANLNCCVFSIHLANRLNDKSPTDAFISGISYKSHGLRLGYNFQCNYNRYVTNYFNHEAFLSLNFGNCCKKSSEGTEAPLKLYY